MSQYSQLAVARQSAQHAATVREAFIDSARREYERAVDDARFRFTERMKFLTDPGTRFGGDVDGRRWCCSANWGNR